MRPQLSAKVGERGLILLTRSAGEVPAIGLFFRNFESTETFRSVSHALLKPIGTLPTTITSGASEFLTTAPAEGIIAGRYWRSLRGVGLSGTDGLVATKLIVHHRNSIGQPES